MEKNEIRSIVLTALFTALIIAGSYLAIPIGPVPIVLASFFVLLAGMLLGPKQGATAVAVFLLLGAVGLPVFSGGKGTIAVLIGPTGGYLLGYLLASLACGFIVQPARSRGKILWVKLIIAALAGTLLFYLPGVPWLKHSLGVDWPKAFAYGLTPFLIGDTIKAMAAVGLAGAFIPLYHGDQS